MSKLGIEGFVLGYTRKAENGAEERVVTIQSYYKRYIQPLDARFHRWDFENNNSKVLCVFKHHMDKNPSLGLIKPKSRRGNELFNCLGCGSAGTVLTLHVRIQKDYYNRVISEYEAAFELCKLYGIDSSEFDEVETDQKGFYERYKAIEDLEQEYTVREYGQDILKARMDFAETHDVEALAYRIDSANVKMIATKKEWIY